MPPTMSRSTLVIPLLAGALFVVCPAALAQTEPQTPPEAPPQETPAPAAKPAEIDQTLVNTWTTLPLKSRHGYFRLTHRFARDLGRGSFGDLADDFFSLDNGAVVGLEFRWGITSALQAGVHRTTLGKTLQAFGRWDALRQSEEAPLAISAAVSIEGQNNLRQDPQPGVSAVLSRAQGTRLVLYASPTYVHNAHTETLRLLHEGHEHEGIEQDADELSDAVDTFFVGLGARARVLETVTLVFEVAPRLAGYTPDSAVWGAAIEKLTRGHVLQLNFGNSFATTPGMLARGGASNEVYLGFNLSRKF
jgi:Membrane bound beta barrel domain (DUF5777)